MTTPNPRAALVAEIGSLTTRVTLVDSVDGEARLIGQAEVPSTVEPPHENPTVAIIAAAEQIGEATGRILVQGGSLVTPQTIERDGVDAVVAVTSAAGEMRVVVAAVSMDVSARSALRASRATYTTTLQVVTLDDTRATRNGEGAAAERTWIERQVEALIGARPDVVIVAGGLEDGAQDALGRLAHIVGMTALTAQVDSQGQARQDITRRPVIYAGNTQARERVIEALSGRADLTIAENVRPTLDEERLTECRRELMRLYEERVLAAMPGMAMLRRMCASPIQTATAAVGVMTRFASERYRRSVLALDVGAASMSAHLAGNGRYTPAVLGAIGTGYGASAVLAERGHMALARWLPFACSERELMHRLLNKMLRPHIPPVTREDLLVEHAVAREALGMALDALWDERPGATYDLVIASGGVLAHAPHPGLALLTILDALQPAAEASVLAIELHLDTLGLMAACGALAFADPDAALTLFERDLLRNTPLATCVVALGEERAGEPALEAELSVTGGGTQRLSLAHGQIGRLALPPGRTGTLRLRPTAGVRVGRNAAGAEVNSEQAAIKGSALGVVVDARGRPLALPSSQPSRQQLVWNWLTALGVEREPLPYPLVEHQPELEGGRVSRPRISLPRISEPRISEPPPSPSRTIEGDLAKLRQTVEEPKRRGLFQRGK
jgi:hypothetical protein